MGFSVLVEMLNLRAARAARPVNLHDPYKASELAALSVPAQGGSLPAKTAPKKPQAPKNQGKKKKSK